MWCEYTLGHAQKVCLSDESDRCDGLADVGGDFFRAARLVGEVGPAGDGVVDLVEDGIGLAGLKAALVGEFQAVVARGLSSFTEDGGHVFAAWAGRVGQVIGGGKGPFTGLVIEDEREVLRMVVTVVGGDVKQHQPKQSQQVGMVSRQCPRDLEQVGVVG